MARLQFRLTNITLDPEEEVSGVTAVVRDDAYKVIASILDDVDTTTRERGGTEMTVRLPLEQMLALFRECGRMDGLDPRSERGGHEIYSSLTLVVYGLIEE